MTIYIEEPRKAAPLFIGAVLSLALCLFLHSGCGPRRPVSVVEELALSSTSGGTADGLVVAAREAGRPGVVLVVPRGTEAEHYRHLLESIEREGYGAAGFSLPNGALEANASLNPVIGDLIEAAIQRLIASGSRADRIALAGAGAGATAAAFYAAANRTIEGVILISPALSEQGLRIEVPFASLQDRPVLLLASENDAYAASTARELKAQSQGFCELRLYPGTANGIDLFALHRDSLQQLFQWLQTCIPADEVLSEG